MEPAAPGKPGKILPSNAYTKLAPERSTSPSFPRQTGGLK